MATRFPLVSVGGATKELPSADTLPLSVFGSQSANLVNASPNGSSGVPVYRALVAADIPNLNTSILNAGTLPIVRGGTNASSFTSGQVTYFNGTALVGSGDLVFGSAILSVGAAAGSGEIRSYQIGGDVYYVAVKTGSGKSGIFRSNTDFFVYYDTNTGQTVLDATFSGNPDILFKIQGTEKARFDGSGNLKLTEKLMIDGLDIEPYFVYEALISQSGTSAPTAAITKNTLGAIVWTRSSAGSYLGTLAGAFSTQDKCWFAPKWAYYPEDDQLVKITYGDANAILLESEVANTGTDTIMTHFPISIRVLKP